MHPIALGTAWSNLCELLSDGGRPDKAFRAALRYAKSQKEGSLTDSELLRTLKKASCSMNRQQVHNATVLLQSMAQECVAQGWSGEQFQRRMGKSLAKGSLHPSSSSAAAVYPPANGKEVLSAFSAVVTEDESVESVGLTSSTARGSVQMTGAVQVVQQTLTYPMGGAGGVSQSQQQWIATVMTSAGQCDESQLRTVTLQVAA